ncbi:MAG: hypothetical protein IKB02_08595 [Clostridia bacterium]|nr:hypothetical protein [Clostridia bacterium]
MENVKKRVFYKELSYVLGLIIMAFGAAFTELADFGMSMVVAPTYIIYLKISEFLPWFSFGVAEYFVQGLLVLLTVLIMRRFKLSYLFSFVTAILYGTVLDGAILLLSSVPNQAFVLRIIWFLIGTVCCSVAVSLFFHTYISPESYELIVKEISQKFSVNINKTKTAYDCISTLLAVVLSFVFFGFGVFKGVGIGTVLCALINGFLIGRISALLERVFEFKNKFDLEKYFER